MRITHVNDQRGIALVTALLVLVVLSVISLVMMTSLHSETKSVGHATRSAGALNVAEAGVAEAVSHLGKGDIPNSMNPRQVAQIFLAPAGSVPVLGADSIAIPTGQPAGAWLGYSSASKGAGVLTVSYKTDAARTVIYRFDASKDPSIQTVSGEPIWVVTATGRRGADNRTVVSEVVRNPIIVKANAALTSKQPIQFSGTSDICGYNHTADVPAQTGAPHGHGCEAWDAGWGHLPAAWSAGTITTTGAASQSGVPAVSPQNQTGFYAGPWEALGMSQADFYAWIGPPTNNEPPNPHGNFYLDNNNIAQDASGLYSYQGGNGEGLLYVDGDLTINGNFTYRGMIYVEGDLKINGTCWVLGAVIAKGRQLLKPNGTCAILFSRDAVTQNLTRYGPRFATLSWREL